MTLTEISNLIQSIVATLPNTVYLRATERDANISLDYIDLEGKTVCLFNNLPEITNSVSQSGLITQMIPIEIQVLQLANIDDTTGEGDTIRDACSDIANSIFDLITKDQYLPDTFEYSIDYVGEFKIYDKTMTGARLGFVFNAYRTTYSC